MTKPHYTNLDEEVSSKTEDNLGYEQENLHLIQQISSKVQLTRLIPPPVILEQYNRIFPDAASRFIAMAEREQEHRHKMQEKLVDAQILDNKRARTERRLGQIFGLTVGVVAIVAGSATAILGAPIAGSIAGGVLGSAGVGGLVFVFILDRREQCHSQNSQLESSDAED